MSAIHDTTTVNNPDPIRRWSRPYVITLSDTYADRNLHRKGTPYKYIQNVGTGGKVMMTWDADGTQVDLYLATGQVLEGGLYYHAMSTGTGAGVDLRGIVGVEGADR